MKLVIHQITMPTKTTTSHRAILPFGWCRSQLMLLIVVIIISVIDAQQPQPSQCIAAPCFYRGECRDRSGLCGDTVAHCNAESQVGVILCGFLWRCRLYFGQVVHLRDVITSNPVGTRLRRWRKHGEASICAASQHADSVSHAVHRRNAPGSVIFRANVALARMVES